MTRAKKGLQKINYERRRECFVGLSPYWHMAEFLVNSKLQHHSSAQKTLWAFGNNFVNCACYTKRFKENLC